MMLNSASRRLRPAARRIVPTLLIAGTLAMAVTTARADVTNDANASVDHTRDGVPSIKVYFGDLDLSATAGMDTLSRRIRRAAETVCGSPAVVGLNSRLIHQRCVDRALTNALAQATTQARQTAATKSAGTQAAACPVPDSRPRER
jgi:UrcA family protein